MKSKAASAKQGRNEITDYDSQDTSTMIDRGKPLTLEHLGLQPPEPPPTQVISLRLPSELLDQLKAFASSRDIPYQALIKLLLTESLQRRGSA